MLIQKLRLQRGWSQQQLAEISGLSVRTIQRLERGQGASLESLKSLAAVFEINFANLQSESDMNTSLNQGVSPEEVLALQHVRKLKGFYIHLSQYVIVVGCLAIFNLVHTPNKLWVAWVALGWGIGILSHGMSVFGMFHLFNAEWEKKQVEKRLGRSL
jgi:transcriptional regulator with XRE-family HTH domain